MSKAKTRPKKYFKKYKEPLVPVPDLVKDQLDSYEEFLYKELEKTILSFSPISDYAEQKFDFKILSITINAPEYDEFHARVNKITYEAPVMANVSLHNKTTGKTREEEVLLANVPYMTPHGTFIINGVERVVVPQLARSYGVFFTLDETPKGEFFGGKIIPSRGIWLEFESDQNKIIYARIDKKRKFPVTSLLRIFGLKTSEEIKKVFSKYEHAKKYIEATLKKDPAENEEQAYSEVFRRVREGSGGSLENMKEYFDSTFSDTLYDLSEVGRRYFNQRFNLPLPEKNKYDATISLDDLILIIQKIAELNDDPKAKPDDIDHLGLRRVRFVGELLDQNVRRGMAQVRRYIQDRMSTVGADIEYPIQIINQRPLQARVKEFFATGQLSQYMEQENILAEIEHLRTLSALGPGGLKRERAGFGVRDVHPSHYGRVCPIHTPEGPNIGLILRTALYAHVNRFGMIETPYIKVKNGKVTSEVVYLNALEEEKYTIAHAANDYDEKGNLTSNFIEARVKGAPGTTSKKDVDFIEVASNCLFSLATSLIPFIEADDANRALMGSNMMKQATPCLIPEAPIVATGMERKAASDTGRILISRTAGEVVACDSEHIIVKDSKGKKEEYKLVNFFRTNDSSAFHQRPCVSVGEKVKKGQVLADTSTTDNGELAIGQNVFVAFMCWEGQNYEDAIILSERLVKNNTFSSIRIEEYECIVRDTKLGPEQTTYDIPNVGETRLRNLDEEGIIREGAEVNEGDILVGKITPKGETELTPEERLLRSIFGEKSRDVKDTSLRVNHGKRGRVVRVKVFSRDEGYKLESGVLKKIYIEVANIRPISVGDKLAGRHGNKGVISIVLPEEDMPYMEDGTPVDVILTPLGVPSRMNLGQILEMHLGMAAKKLNYQAIVPSFAGATSEEIQSELEEAGFQSNGKVKLYDGRNGMPFDQEIAVGYMYILKLHHMVDDKMHARSIGPYSLVTQQPLGGKAQFGGQRFGEMEVWALEGYGAANVLREMITIKSDDIVGRSKAFDAIVKGEKVESAYTAPASFHVLINYLRGLGLNVETSKDGPLDNKKINNLKA